VNATDVSEQGYVGDHLKIFAEKLQIICNFNQICNTVVVHIQSTGTCITVKSTTDSCNASE